MGDAPGSRTSLGHEGGARVRGAEFRVLGPVEVAVDQTTIEIGSAKQRALLATLGRLLTGAQS